MLDARDGLVPTFFLGEGDVGTIFMPADSARICPEILPACVSISFRSFPASWIARTG